MGLEGIVSKKRGSRYKSGDTDLWLKTKTFTEGEFEVLGADLTPTGAPVAILARRNEHGLHYVGDAFITLKAADREDFWAYVEANTVEAPMLPLKRRGTWVKPGLVAKVNPGVNRSVHHRQPVNPVKNHQNCRTNTLSRPA